MGIKQTLINYLPQSLLIRLKNIRAHKPEIIISLLPPKPQTLTGIDTSFNRYRFIRNFLRETFVESSGPRLKFLNAGCGDGTLKGQLFSSEFDEVPLTPKAFFSRFEYFTNEWFDLDLNKIHNQGGEVYVPSHQTTQHMDPSFLESYPKGFHSGHLKGDISSEDFLNQFSEFSESFDVIYNSDVLEHVPQPFTAAKNILKLLKPGGICITITPFCYAYHPDPVDYWRFTHEGLVQLFSGVSPTKLQVLYSGYDITGRRDNRKGASIPIDQFDGWRENWMTVMIFKK